MLDESSEPLGSRIRIGYTLDLDYEIVGGAEFIFNVHAARTDHQRVLTESIVLDPPVDSRVDVEPTSGNRLLRLHAETGRLHVCYTGKVEVAHFMAEPHRVVSGSINDLPPETLPFLWPSRYCQADQVLQLAWREFAHLVPGHAQVDAVAQWVRSHVEFRVGTSDIKTSALETLAQGMGVCRDFAHLTIALLRALNYPARFVTGVDYGADEALGPPDFHAYVEAYIGDRWWLFDATGISPLTGLIRIGTGRDAADCSFATMFGNVRGAMPRVSFEAAHDPEAGVALPQPTTLAVSTAER